MAYPGRYAEGCLDGTDYEIDLSAAHSQALRNSLQTFIAHARKVGGARRAARRRSATAMDTTAVRAWARGQGIDVKERGRVPTDVVTRYREATGQ